MSHLLAGECPCQLANLLVVHCLVPIDTKNIVRTVSRNSGTASQIEVDVYQRRELDDLYQQLLGSVAPWTVGRVELSVQGESGSTSGRRTRRRSAGPARSAEPCGRSTIIRRNGSEGNPAPALQQLRPSAREFPLSTGGRKGFADASPACNARDWRPLGSPVWVYDLNSIWF